MLPSVSNSSTAIPPCKRQRAQIPQPWGVGVGVVGCLVVVVAGVGEPSSDRSSRPTSTIVCALAATWDSVAAVHDVLA